MKLGEMRRLLAEHDLRLTRSLGQNFLHDGNQLRRIVEAAELTPEDKVLEIGPGLGPLTELLLERAGEVLAIEKDARLVEILRQRFNVDQASGPPSGSAGGRTGKMPVLRLLHADALEFLQRKPGDWSEWKLVANLPYSIASPLLVELAQAGRCPKRMVVTLQLEVARRIMAAPGSPDYGVLALLLQLRHEPAGMFKIPASCFFPPPEVDSACVTLNRRPRPLLDARHAETFAKLVKQSFSQRRKMMLKLLKRDWPEERLVAAFAAATLTERTRAEAVGLEQFVQLTKALCDT